MKTSYLKTSLFVIGCFVCSACNTLPEPGNTVTPVLPPFPEANFAMSRVPSNSNRPGAVVFIENGAVVKVDQINAPAGASESNRILSGKVTGTTKKGMNLGFALSLVGAPVSANVGADFNNDTTYTFEWTGASRDVVYLTNTAYSQAIVDWLTNNASANPALAGKKFYLINEAAKATGLKMTMKGNWDNSASASISATISRAVQATPSVKVANNATQEITVTNDLAEPIYVSYTLIPLSIKMGLAGQRTLATGPVTHPENLTATVDKSGK